MEQPVEGKYFEKCSKFLHETSRAHVDDLRATALGKYVFCFSMLRLVLVPTKGVQMSQFVHDVCTHDNNIETETTLMSVASSQRTEHLWDITTHG